MALGGSQGFAAEFQDHSFKGSDRCKVAHLLENILAGQDLTEKRKRCPKLISANFKTPKLSRHYKSPAQITKRTIFFGSPLNNNLHL